MIEITVTPFGSCFVQDVDGLEGQVPRNTTVQNFSAGTTKTFRVTRRAFDGRIRAQLVKLSQMRVPVVDSLPVAGRTRPLITYSVNPVPTQRPRINQVEPAASTLLDLSDAPNVRLKGVNLIPGEAASISIGTGTGLLTITAKDKGPHGNKTKVVINQGTASPAVTTTIDEEGNLTISIVPAVAMAANAIATQIAGNAMANLFVSASSGGAGKVAAQTLTLTGGEDAGVARRIFGSVLASSWLLVQANKPGNGGNAISLQILAASGGGSVSVSGSAITVTPAAGTIGVDAIATQINGNTSAAALVTATATGTSNLSPAVFGPKFLYGGAGEDVVATVGGAVSTIVSHTDTQVVLATSNAALVAAGVTAGELAMVVLLSGYEKLCEIPIAVVA